MEFNLDDCGEMNARAAKTSSMRRAQGADGVSTYTIEHALSLDKSYYKEEVQESDDTLEMYVRLSLGVLWGENKESIQIQRGTFCVSQTSPLVSYSNTGYAMMQKSHYMTDLFSGKETTIETGWPIDPFNEAADQYTCGGAVTGSGFNLMTGEELWYTIELYL